MKIKSDYALALNSMWARSRRPDSAKHMEIESHIQDGVRYIAFIDAPRKDFTESYTPCNFVYDVFGLSESNERYGYPLFMKIWRHLEGTVYREIEQDDRIPICLYGHGRGGAVALIAGYSLTMKHKSLVRVVTFGAPGALNRNDIKNDFTRLLKQVTTQYMLPRDPVKNILRWTKYKSIDRVLLDSDLPGTIDGYVEALGGDSNE